MTTQEVANQLVALLRENKMMEAIDTLYGENIVHKEPKGAPQELTEGFDAVRQGAVMFSEMIEEVHDPGYTSDPLVAGNYFTVSMGMDVTMKGMGRSKMDEVCVYRVQDGKIVYAEFFYDIPEMG